MRINRRTDADAEGRGEGDATMGPVHASMDDVIYAIFETFLPRILSSRGLQNLSVICNGGYSVITCPYWKQEMKSVTICCSYLSPLKDRTHG